MTNWLAAHPMSKFERHTARRGRLVASLRELERLAAKPGMRFDQVASAELAAKIALVRVELDAHDRSVDSA